MSTQTLIVPAGTQTVPFPLTPLQTVCAGPAVQGGTALLEFAPTQTGPWSQWPAGASLAPASFRAPALGSQAGNNLWARVTAATQAASVTISDCGAAIGQFGNYDTLINSQLVFASANVTTETVLFSFKIPPGFLKPNFRIDLDGVASFTNNVNAKTLQVRMNGIGGTLLFQSPALASTANYGFYASLAGIGDGATLKGMGAGTTGGWGTSTTALTTLARDYINNETEIVVSATKATGTDTMQLDSLLVFLR